MIEAVIGLLMFVNGEIKEHRIQHRWQFVYAGNVKRRGPTVKVYLINVGRVRQKLRYTWVKNLLKQ